VLRLAADENFDGRVLRALLTRLPSLDVVRVQDSPVAGQPDPEVLAWTAAQQRVLVTRDRSTMVMHVKNRIASGQPVAGVILLRAAPIADVIEDLGLAIRVLDARDLEGLVLYLPL
jgi:hypothetical protein